MNRKTSLILMSILYVAAGINHFIHPGFYLNILPRYMPFPLQLVYISGGAEIALGGLLLPKSTRTLACWLIIAMLIVFLPVHVQMILDNYASPGIMLFAAIVRLPLQFVLIRWAYLLRTVKPFYMSRHKDRVK
jgi:uncharacterized membrane protein